MSTSTVPVLRQIDNHREHSTAVSRTLPLSRQASDARAVISIDNPALATVSDSTGLALSDLIQLTVSNLVQITWRNSIFYHREQNYK